MVQEHDAVFHLRCIYCILHDRSTVVELVFTVCYLNVTVHHDLHRNRYEIYSGRTNQTD